MYRRRYASIPNDWKVKKIKDISEQVFAGGTPSTRKPEYWDGDIPWMSSGEINKKFIFNTDRRITKEGYESSSTKMVPKNSVLIALAGQGKTRGTVGMNKIELCTNQSIASIVPPDTVDSKFLYYNLDSRYDELRRLSTGDGGRGGLNLQIIKNIFVALPSLEEQRKITSILSTWDKAIELKEKLIEQKKELKKGLMQKLLTGEVRLPGFKGEWKRVKLGDIAEVYQPKTISQMELKESGYPVYGANGLIGFYDKYNHETWQILITCRGSTCGTVNKTSGKAWITGNAMVINVDKTPNVDKDFIYYICFNQNYEKIIGGSGQPQITKKPLENFEVFIPLDVQEQMELASVFHLTDNEITLLEKEVMELKQQKKGLMQLLLTGKVRVKV